MKTLLINIPARDEPSEVPPVACLSLMHYLRKNGQDDVAFYNIDFLRPAIEEAVEYIVKIAPDVLAVSAVVSTSYQYVKQISLMLKKRLPDMKIILGGNMGVAAEILLTKTGVDFIGLGEGEVVLFNFIRSIDVPDFDYRELKGIVFVDKSTGSIVSTGYETPLPSNQLYDYQWGDLSEAFDYYIRDAFDADGSLTLKRFTYDERSYESHRKDKKYTLLMVAKGCVARCTFCHRWEKGIRHIPVKTLMERLDYLICNHNVGFIAIGAEAFGIDKKWLKEFCVEIKKRDILWMAGGVRAHSMTEVIIKDMKEAGCVSLIYGLESGSQKILDIMEKKTLLKENMDAHRWAVDVGFYSTAIQLVLGMPGESPQTVKETIEFCKYCFTLSSKLDPNNFSINYAQSLPGTPLYEYGRQIGLIGTSLEQEEQYLLNVSDTNASSYLDTLNYTGYPLLEMWSWKYKIRVETSMAYINKFGKDAYFEIVLKNKSDDQLPGLYALVVKGRLESILRYYPHVLYNIRSLFPVILWFVTMRKLGARAAIKNIYDYVAYMLFDKRDTSLELLNNRSLRKVVREDFVQFDSDDPDLMFLRKGC